jgi:hypothetical protein
MKNKKLVVTAILLTLVVAVIFMSYETIILFKSWLEGEPRGIVMLNIDIPQTSSETCFIAVHRFPSPYNPTEMALSEVVYRGKVKCGSKVTVKDEINLMQVGVREVDGVIKPRLIPVYDSPEYAVVIISENDGFGKIIQTDIVKPITEIDVKAEFAEASAEQFAAESYCTVHDNPDACVAKARLAYLNSIPGLKVAFGLEGRRSSVMYIEGWGSSCISFDSNSTCPPSAWHSIGMKKTESAVDELSDYVSDGKRAVVWGYVEFRYERHSIRDGEFYWKYELLYPTTIGGLSTPQVIGEYRPSPPPHYAAFGNGDMEIGFMVFESTLSDVKLNLSTSVRLKIGDTLLNISVSPYRAGDDRENTPYIKVVDVSNRSYEWYYWWYKDGDPTTYEVEFYWR